MKNSPLPNVRLVRCPRCTKVLPEPTDVPLYSCGGCGTTLQAKHYKKADEGREIISEGPGSVQNKEVECPDRGGEVSSSGAQLISSGQCSWDQNEGINQSSAQNDNLEQLGVSNPSSSNQPNQQPPSSPDEHRSDLDDEREQNPEITNALREDYTVNEPSPRRHEEPSNLVPQTGEVQGDHSSVEQCGDWKASSSNETMEQPAQLAPGNGEVRQDEIIVEEQLESADFSSEDGSSEATTVRTEQKALSNEVVDELNQNVSINCRPEQDGVASCSSEVPLSNEPSLHKTNSSSKVAAQEGKVEGSNTKLNEERLGVSNISNRPSLSNEPTGGETKFSSQSGSPNGEVVMRDQNIVADHGEEPLGFGMKYESEVSSTNKHNFILERCDSSSQFLTSNQEGEDVSLQSRELSQLMTENRKMDDATVQNDLGECKEDQIVDNLPSEIDSPAEVSTAPDEHANRESEQSFEVDVPATSKSVTEAVIVNLADRSQKTVKANPEEKMEELQKTAADGFESAASFKATEIAAIDTHLQVGTLYRDLPKSSTRNSFTYDGSISSYDGNEAENPVHKDNRQHFPVRNTTYSSSAFEHQTDNPQAVSGSDSCHSAEESSPVLLNERRGPYKRNRMRPRTGEFLSRVPLYRTSPEMSYESSGHASLVHEEFYDHPIHYPPYRRHLHRSDMDARLFAEAMWTVEHLPGHPYYEGSGEIHAYPRHQMYHRGGRRAGYQALAHNMPQIPYSGETVRSGYQVRDLHSHLYPGAYYGRSGWYSPTELVDSYTASPQVFTDSEYYAWNRDTIFEEQMQRDQNTSRLPLGRKSHPVLHIRPIARAAPFITCYQCTELLQLPTDFLLFKGIRVHKVKCSACSSILKFALAKGFHLVPCTSKTEKMSLHSTSEVLERQKSEVESKHSQDKGKSVMVETHNHATGSSSPGVPRHPKVICEELARSNSPLHRLMGYSSPSAVLYGGGSGDSETQE